MSDVKSDKVSEVPVIKNDNGIRRMIYIVRNQQVMLDFNPATLYKVETKRLNERIKRNQNRFPESLCFQLASSWRRILRLPAERFFRTEKF